MLWKIVGVDNHNNEAVADHLHSSGYYGDRGKSAAERICQILNEGLGDGPGRHYCVKEESYRLSRGMEDLV